MRIILALLLCCSLSAQVSNPRQGAQGVTGATGADGAPGSNGADGAPGPSFNAAGAWGCTSYNQYDLVTYDGSSYWATSGNYCQTPYEGSSYWQLNSRKGDNGANGADGSNGSNGKYYYVVSPLYEYSYDTIGIYQSSGSTDGYLSSSDWNTFNNKQDTISGYSGDIYCYDGSSTTNTLHFSNGILTGVN